MTNEGVRPSVTGEEGSLPKALEAKLLPVDEFRNKIEGKVIELKKIGQAIAVLKLLDDGHYAAGIFYGKGAEIPIPLDPSLKDLVEQGNSGVGAIVATRYSYRFSYNNAKLEDIKELLKNMGFGEVSATNLEANLFAIEEKKLGFHARHFYEKDTIVKGGSNLSLPLGPWQLDVAESVDKSGRKFVFNAQDTYFGLKPSPPFKKEPVASDSFQVEPNNKFSLAHIPENVKIENPEEAMVDGNNNFLVIKLSGSKLSIVDKESGDVIKTFEGVKGSINVDNDGTILFVDTENNLREIQTNFKDIAPGNTDGGKAKKKKVLQEALVRFSGLNLSREDRVKSGHIESKDVEDALRERISSLVGETIANSATSEAIDNILEKLNLLIKDPSTAGYSHVIEEFILKANDRLNVIGGQELISRLDSFSISLDTIKSAGDTLGLDEEFGKLLELRGKISVSDIGKRRELEKRILEIQGRKDKIVTQYQGEILGAIETSFPLVEQLVRECRSIQELDLAPLSPEAQRFELMLINVKDPNARNALRQRYNELKLQQRARLGEESRILADKQRAVWVQTLEEIGSDLEPIVNQIGGLSSLREVDRFRISPLVSTLRAKLLTLPKELKEEEEKKLEALIKARREHFNNRSKLAISTDEETIKFGNTRFPIFKEALRIWQPKLVPMGEGSFYADLIFQDQSGKTFHPNPDHPTVVAGDKNDEKTIAAIERHKKSAEEFFKGEKRRIPRFDQHWRIPDYYMGKMEELTKTLILQRINRRGITILHGEAGTGKNVLIDMLANLSNHEEVTVSCNENTVKEDLTYEFHYDPNRGTFRLPSRLIEGIQTPGTIIVLDEINTLRPGVAKLLNPLLDYRRRVFLTEGGKEREIAVDPTVLFVATMNPQNYLAVKKLSPEIKSRARVVDMDYPPFVENQGRNIYRSDEAEVLAAYSEPLMRLTPEEFKKIWDSMYAKKSNGDADLLIAGDKNIEVAVRNIYDILRVADSLRRVYQSYQMGEGSTALDFPFGLREGIDIVIEMGTDSKPKDVIRQVIVPKIDDRKQKKDVEIMINTILT